MVQADDVQTLLNRLPDTSNLDVLGMDSKLLRLGSRVLSKSVSKLINLCIHNGIFPTELQKARVTPVYKNKGSQIECGNETIKHGI